MVDTSARFALPLIAPGQAQKEVYHNEALASVDSALHPSVEAGPASDPPSAPALGESWIVSTMPGGEWSAHPNALATWTDGGWRFIAPVPGMSAWNKAAGHWLHWDGEAWIDGALPVSSLVIAGQQVVGPRLPQVTSPSGGTIIDAEARGAIEALIATLKSHGLTD